MGTTAPIRASQRRLTLKDYLALPEDGRRYELIAGELSMSPSPIARHQRISRNLERLLDEGLEEKGLGRVYHAPIDVVLSNSDVVVPDIAFIRTERLAIVGDHIKGAPDLLIEILSPSSRHRDMIEKLKLYAQSGIASYWLVDPLGEQVTLYRLKVLSVRRRKVNVFEQVAQHHRPAIGLPKEFPGFKLPLEKVFAP